MSLFEPKSQSCKVAATTHELVSTTMSCKTKCLSCAPQLEIHFPTSNETERLIQHIHHYEFYFFFVLKGKKKKGKVIPLHAMQAHGVRGGIAPTHS
jgi:hypothetical protein